MLSNESYFRLFSVAILGALFISATAIASKEKDTSTKSLFSIIEHVEDAEKINNGSFHVLNLTSIGERVELVELKSEDPIKSLK